MYNALDTGMLKIPGTVKELAPIAKRHGFEGIGVPVGLMDDEQEALESAAVVKDLGMKWGLLPTPVDFFHEKIGSGELEQALAVLARWAGLGEKIGVKYSYNHIWPSSSQRAFAENFEWHVKRLEKIQRIFTDHGIRYGLEFLGPHELRIKHSHPFVHTIAGVLAIADAAGGKTGFLFDTYHWHCGSRRRDDLYFAAQHVGRMVNLHLNDGTSGLEPDQQRDLMRQMPMTTGVIDARMIYQTFKASGYQGPAMCEPMAPSTDRFAILPPEESIGEVAAAFARLDASPSHPKAAIR